MREILDKYRTHSSVYVEDKPFSGFRSLACGTIAILPQLVGRKYDEYALGLVLAMRPERIRVTTGVTTCDGDSGRITVYVDEEDIIKHVEMGVSIPNNEGSFIDFQKASKLDLNDRVRKDLL